MKIKRTIRLEQICLVIILLSSCGAEEKKKEIWPPPKNTSNSYEIINRDTCNRLVYGYKQGLWYLLDSAKLRLGKRVIKDTLYFRNDTVIEN